MFTKRIYGGAHDKVIENCGNMENSLYIQPLLMGLDRLRLIDETGFYWLLQHLVRKAGYHLDNPGSVSAYLSAYDQKKRKSTAH